jgi:hypothetical protein
VEQSVTRLLQFQDVSTFFLLLKHSNCCRPFSSPPVSPPSLSYQYHPVFNASSASSFLSHKPLTRIKYHHHHNFNRIFSKHSSSLHYLLHIIYTRASHSGVGKLSKSFSFFPWSWGGSSTQAWMPTYVSILRIPKMIWAWRATVEWYIDRGKPKTRRRTCPSATLSTTNPTWIDPDANPDLRGETPATNDLSHGTASNPSLNFWLRIVESFKLF